MGDVLLSCARQEITIFALFLFRQEGGCYFLVPGKKLHYLPFSCFGKRVGVTFLYQTRNYIICPFLVSARKGRKEADLKGAELLAPASKASPLRNPRRASPVAPENLNLDPVQAENVPIFCLKERLSRIGRAAFAEQPPPVSPYVCNLRSLRCRAVMALRDGRGT